MPLTGPWLSHPVASTAAAITALRDALLDLRRTPIPFPGHATVPNRTAREPDSERRWGLKLKDCRTLVGSLFDRATDDDIWKTLTPALSGSLSGSPSADRAIVQLVALKRALDSQPTPAGATWVPSAGWWSSATAALAQPMTITQADIDAESRVAKSFGPCLCARPGAASTPGEEVATEDGAAPGGRMIDLYYAAFVLSRHLAQPEPAEDELTQAALAFRELAVVHGHPPPADLFRRLAIRGCPYYRFAGNFPVRSATEALWAYTRDIYKALADAILRVLPSREVEAGRVRAGVIHWSEWDTVRRLVRESCEHWAGTLEFAHGLTAQLDLESEFLQQEDERALLASALRSGMDEVVEKIRRLAPQWKMTVGARLLMLVADNPREVLDSSADDISKKLNCAKSTVIESKAWELFRTLQEAERSRRR